VDLKMMWRVFNSFKIQPKYLRMYSLAKNDLGGRKMMNFNGLEGEVWVVHFKGFKGENEWI